MALRQQYTNDELVHKLRSMLNDLPTLRTRAMKKLKYWREAAIKRLLARQRELEKTLMNKFERLESDTQMFVQKIERSQANHQRRWHTETIDYQNKTDIDRISTNLRSIREELEQSKLILAGTMTDDDLQETIVDDLIPGKLASTSSRYSSSLSSKSPAKKIYENNDLGSELKRVLEICTSPQRSSSSLSADELSTLQLIDHGDLLNDTKSKQTTSKVNSAIPPKHVSQTVATNRRNSRTITNIPIQQQNESTEQSINNQNNNNNNNNSNNKLFAFESFDDSIRRFQRLREIRKNLRNKYEDATIGQMNLEPKSVATSMTIDNNESFTENRHGSQQKNLNQNHNRQTTNSTNSIATATLTTTKTSVGTSMTPKKNGESRHVMSNREPVSIPIERIPSSSNVVTKDPEHVEALDSTTTTTTTTTAQIFEKAPINTYQDRRHRSRTLEPHQIQAVDNQIYGCPSSTPNKQTTNNRSESHKHRNQRLSFRRSSEDHQDKQLQMRRGNEYHTGSTHHILNETWFDIAPEHWTNLLENGWRPTVDTNGVTPVAIVDSDHSNLRGRKQESLNSKPIDLYEQLTRNEYYSLFEQLEFAYGRTINLGNEFWRFLEIDGNHHLCLYHQLNKQFIMYKPDASLLSFPWPYDGIVDISWSKPNLVWVVATQTQIIICNRSFSKIFQSIDIKGDWPKRVTSCKSSIFHTYKIPQASINSSSTSTLYRPSDKERPQFLLERYDYKLNSLGKHILESSTIWDIEADDLTEHLAILCDVALLIFDYQLNLLKRIEVTGFKVTTDYFGGWLVADYNASCLWQIRRNEYVKAHKILHVERPWSVILDRSTWTLVTLSETQNRAKRLLFFTMKNIPSALEQLDTPQTQTQLSVSTSSSVSN